VLGSAVYVGRWMREALSFVGANSSRLAAMPVWLFSSGPLGPPGHPIPSTDPADVADMVALTAAREHRVFGGRLDRSQLGIAERAMVRATHARYGDDRDWDAIDRFAGDIAAALTGVSVHG
jgi:menaquinone-dependent protoporphyrinogen oxidase